YNKRQTQSAVDRIGILKARELPHYRGATKEPWENQLGSLGSGNHFIELCLDEDQRIWVVLHSGSRGIGNKLAMRHISIAQKLVDAQGDRLHNRDLAWLKSGNKEFSAYIADLLWSQHFALLNREEMMDRVMSDLSRYLYGEDG